VTAVTTTGKTVLVVDDSPAIHELVGAALGPAFRVLAAWHGDEGLAAAREHRPDLILMDVEMPGLNGIEACRRLTADPELSHIPVVIITGDSDPERWQQARAAGAALLLPKPFSPAALVAHARALVGA
jgi:CheY-like chemotaxis protein